MKVNTALCFLLMGISLILINHDKTPQPDILRKIFFPTIIGIVIFTGVISLIQYIFNLNFGVDEIIYKDDINLIGTSNPGRMAPSTAICFILFGVSFLFIKYQKKWNPVFFQSLSLVSGTFSFIGLMSYLFETEKGYGVMGFTGMAFHTSCCFILMTLAILFSCPDLGMMKPISGTSSASKTFRVLFPIGISLLIGLGWFHLKAEQYGVFERNYGDVFQVIILIFVAGIIFWISTHSLSKKEELIAENEQRYRTLFNVSPVGIMLTNEKGIIIEINNAISKMVQYSRLELIHNDVRMLIPLENRNNVDENIKRILGGETLYHTSVNKRKDGTFCTVELTETSFTLPDKSIGILTVANDITERKKAEDELKESVQNLSDIAFMQSHQVRAPIAQILGLINLFKFEEPNDPVNAEILTHLKKSANSFDKIIYKITEKTNVIERQ